MSIMRSDPHTNETIISSEAHEELLRLMTQLEELASSVLPVVDTPVTHNDYRVHDGYKQVLVTALRASELLSGCSDELPEAGREIPEGEVCVSPVEVKALSPYRIWLRYDDGVEGEVDLSHLAGKGVYVAWEEPTFFSRVKLGPGGGIEWGDDDRTIDICGDALYMNITGMTPEEMLPRLMPFRDA